MFAAAPPGSSTPTLERPTVVLVDDDHGLREALRFALEIDHYRVETCSTGEELIELDLPTRSACLVIDYRLQGIDGLAALARLRARGVELPAILITSYASPAVLERARRARAAVIEKPLLGDVLLALISEFVPPTAAT